MDDFELFEAPDYPYNELDLKPSGQKKKYRIKWHLIGFNSEADTIKLDSSVSIKRVSLREREKFYENTDSLHEIDKITLVEDHEFMLVWNYESIWPWNNLWDSKAHIISAQVESFFKLFLRIDVGLKYNAEYRYNSENQRYERTGAFFQTFRKIPFYGHRDIIKFDKKGSQSIRKLWRLYWDIDLDKNKAIRVALNRFFDSEHRGRDDDSIIDLMIGLEAIFLSEFSELKQRLSLRISKYLENEQSPELVYEFMKAAYKVRSKVAHGNTFSNKDFKFNGYDYDIHYFHMFLREILRLCLVRYFHEFRHVELKKLHEMIDKAIINSQPLGFGK